MVILSGSTKAVLSYSGTDQKHIVVLMYGAWAEIRAGNYAVVFVTNAGGEVEIVNDGTALIL